MRADVPADRHGLDADGARRARRCDRGGGLIAERVASADELIAELLAFDEALGLRSYYGERSLFFNPGRAAPLGVIFASFKDADGPNDRSSRLSRAGVFRLAFQLTPHDYEGRFGPPPARPPRGGVVAFDADPAELDRVLPHPVYAWMRWVQVLSPTAETFGSLRPALGRSLEDVRAKWARRRAAA